MIVDEKVKSREVPEYNLRTIPGVEIPANVSGANEAYRKIPDHVPVIPFLDPEMNGKTLDFREMKKHSWTKVDRSMIRSIVDMYCSILKKQV